ncbi:MAG: tyrosine-type recombinase/integrase [Enterobacterales bacterium]|nr:tyrosine-type recombinase/integrase [Enterobacterales bacterium]
MPTVFTHQEAMQVIGVNQGDYQLMVKLMYGSGLRISELTRLRVKDIDFGMKQIIVQQRYQTVKLWPISYNNPGQFPTNIAEMAYKVSC